jgi:hypothetical protein
MLHRGPRSVPILLFAFLALLDLLVMLPGGTLILEPAAAGVLATAVILAWCDRTGRVRDTPISRPVTPDQLVSH